MTEANHIDTSFDSQSNFSSIPIANNDQVEYQKEVTATSRQFCAENNHLSLDSLPNQAVSQPDNAENTEPRGSLGQKMNWQKVAHKLREYNRKLLKKVFRLEQELAEIDNKFNKHVEKSQNSDLLIAQQAEEIKNFQEKISLMSQKLASSEQQISNQETIINNISQQYELSQKQAAQLERECTLLQENYDQKTYELAAKEQETKELKTKLSQEQRCALQYKADLQRYLEQAQASSKAKIASRQENLSNNKSIQPWSTSSSPEPKISLPQTKPQAVPVNRLVARASETIKTAAEIATWSDSTYRSPSTTNKTADLPLTSSTSTPSQTQTAKAANKSSTGKKPQSLAAVDLPSFTRRS